MSLFLSCGFTGVVVCKWIYSPFRGSPEVNAKYVKKRIQGWEAGNEDGDGRRNNHGNPVFSILTDTRPVLKTFRFPVMRCLIIQVYRW
jgi:hypothetical protein